MEQAWFPGGAVNPPSFRDQVHRYHNSAARSLSTTLLLSTLSLATSAACAAEPIIGLITKTESNPFFVKMKEGANAEAKKLGAKPIMITPSDAKAIIPAIKKAQAQGVQVIALDSPTDPASAVDALFATDNYKAGVLIGQWGTTMRLVLADANFTAMRIAAGKPVIRLPGSSMRQAVRAVTSLMPLATDVAYPAVFMAVSGTAPDYRSAMQRDVIDLLDPQLLAEQSVEPIERFAFYDRARAAYAIVLTGEKQPFGNFILRQGVIGETLRP